MRREELNKKLFLIFFLIVFGIIIFNLSKVISWTSQKEIKQKNPFSFAVLFLADVLEGLKEKMFFSEKRPEEKPEEEVFSEKENFKEDFSLKTPYKILIIGDSFIAVRGGVGEILEKELLNYKEVEVKRLGVVSSGLSRKDYFNWYAKTEELIKEFLPNIAIVMIGSNDAQSITEENGKTIIAYSEEDWNEGYRKRISQLLEIFQKNKIVVFWIGFPPMREKNYSQKIQNLNSLYEEECQKRKNVYFFSTWELFSDEKGNYRIFAPDEKGINRILRQEDGIHLTLFGGEFLVNHFISFVKEIIPLEVKIQENV